MQTRGRNERLAESGEKMVLRGLRVAGESGRARASLGDSRLSIEFKTGNCIDIRYDQILRMQHHNTTLVPSWVAFIGFCILWASWRVITPPDIRLLGLLAGIAMISGWVLTKRPTLTIDTKFGDCHVFHAIDSRLLKLSTMIQRMNDGLSLEQARVGVDLLNEDTEFPRQAADFAARAIPAPIEDLVAPRSISKFMGDMVPEKDEFEIDEVMPRWATDSMRSTSSVMDELEPREHGIIERGRANIGTRRGHTSPLDIEPVPAPSQVMSPHFSGDSLLPVPMHQQTMSSSRMIQEAQGESHESRNFAFTPLPTNHLPSFVGPEGAHIPSTPDAFTSPDLPLFDPDALVEEHSLSLAEQGEIRHQEDRPSETTAGTSVRRDSKGRLKRLQRRTAPKRRIASSRQDAQHGTTRRFSSMITKVRDRIYGLSEEGIDDELIEILGEHISEEDEQQVPSSFSALTESQEAAPTQASQHGLRRID
ncbi:MAG: hypothetical protein QGF34_00400 [Candidatus Poseidoniaceae archaeon]|nr:hypothetical protein [Candidatus Poseidoniaceae archaeon]